MKKLLPLIISLLVVGTSLQAQVNITIELNAATIQTIDPSGLYIAGGSGFGSPGDNQLTDPDGDGIYSVTIQRDAGFSSFYTFTNGACGDYSCKENISGLPCSDPANFNDRFLPPVFADTTIKACFGTCDSDGSCTIPTDSINITFELNTATIDMIDPTGIYLAGGGNFGNPGDNPMIDPDGDGIYSITVRKPIGFVSYYTFTNGACGDWSCKENLDGLPCGDPNSFNDRILGPVEADTTLLLCFGTCDTDGTCTVVSTDILEEEAYKISLAPTIARESCMLIFEEQAVYEPKELQVVSLTGIVMESLRLGSGGTHLINTSLYPTGIYYIRVRIIGKNHNFKLLVQR